MSTIGNEVSAGANRMPGRRNAVPAGGDEVSAEADSMPDH
jgi:hypothetical protein